MFGNARVSQRIAAGVLSGAALAAALSGCSHAATVAPGVTVSSAAPSAGGPVIDLKLLMFSQNRVTVPVGTRVTWRNDEDITHTVTSGQFLGVDKSTGLRSSQRPDGLFDAKLQAKGDGFSYTFAKSGTFSYYCDIHQGMNAQIVVTG